MTKNIIMVMLAAVAFCVVPTVGAHGFNRDRGVAIEIENDDMFVKTNTVSSADSGRINQMAVGNWGGDVIQRTTTGIAAADAFSGVAVGYTKLPCACGMRSGEIEIENDDLYVSTTTRATASTGKVNQWGVATSPRSDVWESVTTGNAGSAAESQIMVGYTDFSVSLPN